MRFITLHIAAIVAGAVLGAGAAPSSPARGSALSKLRRAAEAVDEVLEDPVDVTAIERNPVCYAENGACDLARREAAVLADVIAEAQAQATAGDGSFANPAPAPSIPEGWCHAPGGYCDKMKRETDVIEAKALAIDAHEAHMMKRDVNSDYEDALLQKCKRPGQPCNVARDNMSLAVRNLAARYKGKSVKDNAAVPATNFVGVQAYCHRRGEPCLKLKRAVYLIADLSAEDVDELSENEKRSIDPARRALSEVGKIVALRQEKLTESGLVA